MNFDNDDENQQNKFIMPPVNNNSKPINFLPSEEEYKQIVKALPEEELKTEKPVNLMANNSTDLYQTSPRVYAVDNPKSNVAIIVVLSLILLLVLGYILFVYYNTASRKMTCESEQGNIIIYYNKKSVVGYKSNTITYDLYEQRQYADEIGIVKYLDEFSTWFNTTTKGNCKR